MPAAPDTLAHHLRMRADHFGLNSRRKSSPLA